MLSSYLILYSRSTTPSKSSVADNRKNIAKYLAIDIVRVKSYLIGTSMAYEKALIQLNR